MSNLNNNSGNNENLVFVAEKPWLSVKEFSAYTGYQVSYVYKLVSERKVPCYKRDGGKNVFFLKDEIDKWILGHRIAPMEELEEQAVRYVAKNSIEDVVFSPSRRMNLDDKEGKEKSSAASNRASATKPKTKGKPSPKAKGKAAVKEEEKPKRKGGNAQAKGKPKARQKKK